MSHPASRLLCALALSTACLGVSAHAQSWQQATKYTGEKTTFGNDPAIFPPWDNAPTTMAKNFTVPEVDNLPDLHGDVTNPQLVIYFAGNQYMMVEDLVNGFKKAYPQYKRVFYVTLPPGILIESIEKHQGRFAIGNLTFSYHPDIVTRGKGGMEKLQQQKHWFSKMENYAGNTLALMVAKGNPKHITGLADLARSDVRISMPNPQWEGIATPIQKAYVEAGGNALKTTIMDTKKDAGETYLTHIHHRQTPMRIMAGLSDVGPVWVTEAEYQSHRFPDRIAMVRIPKDHNVHVVYTAGQFKNAPHPKAASAFMAYMMSKAGQKIITSYGFQGASGK